MKRYFKYLFFFCFFLAIFLLFEYNNADVIWNYSYSHAIRMGEIPYLDFCFVTTPFYSFLMSSGLLLWDSFFVFLVENAILCTMMLFLFDKIFENKGVFFLPLLCFPSFSVFSPNYNLLVLFLLILLVYLEKEKKEDWMIGLVLGLLVITKHTIGGALLFLSIIGIKNWRKGKIRFLFSMIPIGIFVIYLWMTKSMFDFLNLSVLGLLDFFQSNHTVSFLGVLLLIPVLLGIFLLRKKTNSIFIYYCIGSALFIIPIVDLNHISYFVSFCLIVYFMMHPIPNVEKYMLSSALVMITIFLCNVCFHMNTYQSLGKHSFPHFDFYLMTQDTIQSAQKISDQYQKYDSVMMFSPQSAFFDIVTNHKISYFDNPCRGNYGYHGISSMKKKITQFKDTYLFVSDATGNSQFAQEIVDYVRSHYPLVDQVEDYEIYYIQ